MFARTDIKCIIVDSALTYINSPATPIPYYLIFTRQKKSLIDHKDITVYNTTQLNKGLDQFSILGTYAQ